jgi:hypothetical protein
MEYWKKHSGIETALSKTFPRRTWRRAAAAGLLLVVAAGAMKVEQFNAMWKEMADLRKRSSLDSYISFVADDAGHPPTNPKRARPLFVAGRDVRLKGRAEPQIIQEIEISVDPGLEEELPSVQTVPITAEPADKKPPGSFDAGFAAPSDGQRRKVTIRLIPTEQARPHLAEENLTYEVWIACSPTGAQAYVPPAQPPKIIGVERKPGAPETTFLVESVTDENIYITISIAKRGGRIAEVQKPRSVSKAGQTLRFTVFLGAAHEYEVRAYAARDPSQLTFDRINDEEIRNLLVSDPWLEKGSTRD